MGCLGIILPILGLVGYYYGIDWLFYIAGGLTAVMDIIALIQGELTPIYKDGLPVHLVRK